LFILYLKNINKMVKKILFGNEIEKMPDFAFRMMKIFFIIYYFFKPAGKYLRKFGIKPGYVVVDYGCGTGACIKDASSLAGENGTVLTDGNRSILHNETADLVYAMDMFHMVKDTDSFLKELNRITKKEGTLIIEDGHQPRSASREKILKSGCWEIIGEKKRFLKCTPTKLIV
jgi:SAM-dependent methyltransferase